MDVRTENTHNPGASSVQFIIIITCLLVYAYSMLTLCSNNKNVMPKSMFKVISNNSGRYPRCDNLLKNKLNSHANQSLFIWSLILSLFSPNISKITMKE